MPPTKPSAASLSAAQVAARLGVKAQTVYAYVSRGLLQRTLSADGRRSHFDPSEVEQLARRGRPRRGSERVGAVDVPLSSAITRLQDDRLSYRGHDVARLSARATFEQVAWLLWTGQMPAEDALPAMPVLDPTVRAVLDALPAACAPLDRFMVATGALCCVRPLRVDLRGDTVVAHAHALLSTLVHALPLPTLQSPQPAPGKGGGVAAQLWPRLSSLRASKARVSLLDCALVLLADHELSTSTLAARVAASTRADPYAAVLAGLSTVSGPLHGRAAAATVALLANAAEHGVEAALAAALASSGALPGFGHPVYRSADPRAATMLSRLYVDKVADRRRCELVQAVGRAAKRQTDLPLNVDFALGALCYATRMRPSASEALFAVARTAGWVAHVLEEYEQAPLRFRARALYSGGSS